MARPWEESPTRAWELQQPLYERTISIYRSQNNASNSQPSVGLVTYSSRDDVTASSDPHGGTQIATNIPANIEFRRHGRTRGTTLPADSTADPLYQIACPWSSLTLYSVRDRDTIIDDEGYRYIVVSNYWTTEGYQFECIRLET